MSKQRQAIKRIERELVMRAKLKRIREEIMRVAQAEAEAQKQKCIGCLWLKWDGVTAYCPRSRCERDTER